MKINFVIIKIAMLMDMINNLKGYDKMLNLINFGIGVATLYIAFQIILAIIGIAFTIFVLRKIFKEFK